MLTFPLTPPLSSAVGRKTSVILKCLVINDCTSKITKVEKLLYSVFPTNLYGPSIIIKFHICHKIIRVETSFNSPAALK